MTEAENYKIMIDGEKFRSRVHYLIRMARNDAIAENFDKYGQIVSVEFSDGSILSVADYL